MHDLVDKPPNACLLASLKPNAPEILNSTILIPYLDISTSPFLQLQTICVHLDVMAEHPFSLSFHPCHHMKHSSSTDWFLFLVSMVAAAGLLYCCYE